MNTGKILMPGLYGIELEDNEDREGTSLFVPLKDIYTIDLKVPIGPSHNLWNKNNKSHYIKQLTFLSICSLAEFFTPIRSKDLGN